MDQNQSAHHGPHVNVSVHWDEPSLSLRTPAPESSCVDNDVTAVGNGDVLMTLSEGQNDALLYIIVVLAFYSFAIVFMLIKYLKQERSDLEEDSLLEAYLRARPSWALGYYRNRTVYTTPAKLALTALNTVNVVVQPSNKGGKVTFVWLRIQNVGFGISFVWYT